MTFRVRTTVLAATLTCLVAACGDGNDNHNPDGTPIPTPTTTATAPPQIPCPELVTYTVRSEGSNLDVGWTGIFYNQLLGDGGSLSFSLDCPGSFLGQCGACALSGPIASTTIVDNQRCQNATETPCTTDADCGGSACAFFFGAPLPISGGGVPICVTNRIDGAVTGTVIPELGEGTSNISTVFTSFVGIAVERPCPVCTGATLGATGTCQGGRLDGQACTTDGTTLFFGNTSFDCPPSPGADIGSSTLPLNLTTGTRELNTTATCRTGSDDPCYCQDQVQANQCLDGICSVDASAKGTCAVGPTDPTCLIETFRSCTTNADCPGPNDSCTARIRGCLGPTDAAGKLIGPIVITGQPSPATPLQVATFCIAKTRSPGVNSAAGFPGPGTLRLPTTVCIKTSCP